MSFLTCFGRGHRTLNVLKLATSILSVPLLVTSFAAQEPRPNQAVSNILEENFAFPPPIQWRMGEMEVSLIALAWGPANSPEMIAKGREVRARENPEFFSARPYALAMRFRATLTSPRFLEMSTTSGLAQIKNVEGNLEYPSDLTPSGFVPGTYDLHFTQNAKTTEYWDFFPASPAQKEFLFRAVPPSNRAKLSFRIIVKDNRFVIINVSPGAEAKALQFRKNFSGTIGAESKVNLQLTGKGPELSGAEQYAGVGKTLWLKGMVDSLDNFILKEYYPKDQVTGIFQGKFSYNYGVMTGYFSKPDGSRLQPFEFREVVAPSRSGKNGTDSRP